MGYLLRRRASRLPKVLIQIGGEPNPGGTEHKLMDIQDGCLSHIHALWTSLTCIFQHVGTEVPRENPHDPAGTCTLHTDRARAGLQLPTIEVCLISSKVTLVLRR